MMLPSNSGLTFDWDDITVADATVQKALQTLLAEFGPRVWVRTSSSGNGLHVMIAELTYDSLFGVVLSPVPMSLSDQMLWRKVFSEEHRRKLSDAKQGDKHPNFGKKFTIETRKKISESGSKGYIVCLHGNYKNNKYKMKEWCEILCISKSYLSEHLSGKRFKNGIKGNFFKWEHEIQS